MEPAPARRSEAEAQCEVAASACPDASVPLRLITWNLAGLDEDRIDERAEAAVFTLLLGGTLHQLGSAGPAAPADVIVLQEVTRRTFLGHLAPHLAAVGYQVRPAGPPDRELFELIAVRPPWTIRSHQLRDLRESQFGRILHQVEIGNVDRPGLAALSVMTGHLDSGPASRGRRAQLSQVLSEIGPRSVFAGDMNIRVSEWDEISARASERGVSDAWEQLGTPETGRVTWRGDGGRAARFDRVLYGAQLRPVGMTVRGAQPIGPDLWISDHVGICTDFCVST